MKQIIFPICFLLLFYSCKDHPTENKQKIAEPDSTSNNFIWRIDTLGAYGSYLRDVWGPSANSVYAVGRITSSNDFTIETCIVHWDGVKWTPLNLIASVYSIYGFSDNDIWLGGDDWVIHAPHAVIYHWNGIKWNKDSLDFPFAVTKLWGTSSKNMYAIGGKGFVLRNNGSGWKQMTTNTQEYLYDIWGTSDSDIYVAGGNSDLGTGILLRYDGKIWTTIYDQNAISHGNNPVGEISGIWGYDKNNYIISPWSGTYQGAGNYWLPITPPIDHVFIEAIRGTSSKNYFLIGDYDLIVHWNGKRWHRFDGYYRPAHFDNLWALSVFDSEVFIVGATAESFQYQALVHHGTMVY